MLSLESGPIVLMEGQPDTKGFSIFRFGPITADLCELYRKHLHARACAGTVRLGIF